MDGVLILREEYQEPPTAEGRILTLRLATIGRTYTIGRERGRPVRERILPGAFKEPLARPRGVLRFRHNGEREGERDSLDNIYGTIQRMWLDGDQVLSDWQVLPGEDGDKVLQIAPHIKGASITAIVRDSRRGSDGATEITRISDVNAVSLTPEPAYDDAGLVAMREARRRSGLAAVVERERKANAAARRMLGSR